MSGAPETVAAMYDRNAAAWDEDRQHSRPVGEYRWVRRFTEEAGPGAHILDIGCGSGEPIAADLLAAGLTVTGVDSSPALIDLCRARFPDQKWIVHDMRQLSLGRRFGGALAWHSLFHLKPDDQQRMFVVFARHLLPGAPLMFTSGSVRGESIGSWRGEALYHASLDRSDYEAQLAASGFETLSYVEGDESCGGATIWMARRKGA